MRIASRAWVVVAIAPMTFIACKFVADIEDLELVSDASAIADTGSQVYAVESEASFGSRVDEGGVVDALVVDAAVFDAVFDTGATPISCDGGIVCNGTCVDPRDPNHCGACGNVCATGLCGTSIAETMAAMPSNWSFNGSARYNSSAPSGEITVPDVTNQAGTIVYTHPVVVDSFDAVFNFRIGLYGGSLRSDGMAFLIQRTGSTAVGASGGGLGMVGLLGYAVELDIYDNPACSDPNNNHLGVDLLGGSICNPPDPMPTSLFSASVTSSFGDLADGSWHTARVVLENGAISAWLGTIPVASAVALPSYQAGVPYYFGFAGATGGNGYRSEVRAISIAFPTPRCL